MKNLNRKTTTDQKPKVSYKSEQISFDDLAMMNKISEPLPTKLPEKVDKVESESNPQVEKSTKQLLGTPIFEDPEHLKSWDERMKQEKQVKVIADEENSDRENNTSDFPDLRYIGQIHGTYLVAESPDGFYLVDQHAAQERVNYEYYRKEIGKVSNDQQRLLVPIVLDYPNSESILIREKKDILESIGLYLEDFGQNSFVVNTHPTWFVAGQEESTIREMVDYVLNDSKISVAAFREKNAIMMSCKRAIKANHHLDEVQAISLLKNLTKAENPYNCPHGRPVLVEFSNKDLEKMFKRIQDPHDTRESE